MSTEITTTPSQSLAELAAAEIAGQVTAEDLSIPRMYVGQPSSDAVQLDRAPVGSIYLATGKEDTEPIVIYTQDSKSGVLVHLLTMKKVWCFNDDDGTFRVVIDGPDMPRLDAAREYQRGYQMILCLPTFDRELPVSALLKSTAIPTARKIITAVTKSKAAPWESAFELRTEPRSNQKGRWFVPAATTVKAQKRHMEAAAALAELIGVGRSRPEIAAEAEPEDEPIPY